VVESLSFGIMTHQKDLFPWKKGIENSRVKKKVSPRLNFYKNPKQIHFLSRHPELYTTGYCIMKNFSIFVSIKKRFAYT